jgi:uridine phosphorylase
VFNNVYFCAKREEMAYPHTELVLDSNGNPYHIGVGPGDLSQKVLLVGDQDRVQLIAEQFDKIHFRSQHREFCCITGTYKGETISALSTGIGTDNIDIVINELDAVFNIDLKSRDDKQKHTRLDLIRIGTCGILHPEVPVHSYILSSHAYGLDNVAHFYEIDFDQEETNLEESISNHLNLPTKVKPYLCSASSILNKKLRSEKVVEGVTITSSGFYGPQGRQLRLRNRTMTLNDKLSSFSHDKYRITNFEMESSALFSLGKALGHNCTTICLGIANRPNKEFSSGYQEDMRKLIEYVLDRI